MPHGSDETIMDSESSESRTAQELVRQAELLLQRGQVDRAIATLDEAYRLAPGLTAETYARILLQRGQGREQRNQLSDALADYLTGLNVAPPGGLHDLLSELASRTQTTLISSTSRCNRCGQPIQPTWLICPNCGLELQAAAVKPAVGPAVGPAARPAAPPTRRRPDYAAEPVAAPPRGGFPTWAWLVVGSLIIGIVILAIAIAAVMVAIMTGVIPAGSLPFLTFTQTPAAALSPSPPPSAVGPTATSTQPAVSLTFTLPPPTATVAPSATATRQPPTRTFTPRPPTDTPTRTATVVRRVWTATPRRSPGVGEVRVVNTSSITVLVIMWGPSPLTQFSVSAGTTEIRALATGDYGWQITANNCEYGQGLPNLRLQAAAKIEILPDSSQCGWTMRYTDSLP